MESRFCREDWEADVQTEIGTLGRLGTLDTTGTLCTLGTMQTSGVNLKQIKLIDEIYITKILVCIEGLIIRYLEICNKYIIFYLLSPDIVILDPATVGLPSLSSFPVVSSLMIVVPRLPKACCGWFCGDCRGKGTDGNVGGGREG